MGPGCASVVVVGGGLAGCEVAWQLAERGIRVTVVEMRPTRMTPAHRGDGLAELVCSNSFRADRPVNAVGLLKREMAALASLVMASARAVAVPAGRALAVDREAFSSRITAALDTHPLITVERREVVTIPRGPAVLATGPLTAPRLHRALDKLLGEHALAFFDAVAPIVADESLDHARLFRASRYDDAGGDYLNAALSRDQYERFVAELKSAMTVPFRDYESADLRYFEGCLPIEVMAQRGPDTLRYGPLKPVGLIDPRTGRQPWAVVQLRQDDLAAEYWNLVGFQTKLTVREQRRVLRMIPGLEQARFVRFGMIHRNTFVNAPRHLDALIRLRLRPDLWLAGQITGVEGYVESAATGLIVGLNLAADLRGMTPRPPPPETACGGLVRHLGGRRPEDFQPANISWGLIRCPDELRAVRDRQQRRERQTEIALQRIREWAADVDGRSRSC